MESTHDVNDILARVGALERREKHWRWASLILVGALVGLPLVAGALEPVPFDFVGGQPIKADDMDANFMHLVSAVDELEEFMVPSGALSYFNASSCRAGWSELTAGRGRTIVGMAGSAGSLAGTVGEPLGDLEERAHTHSVDLPSGVTDSAGEHNHQWIDSQGSNMVDAFDINGDPANRVALGVVVGTDAYIFIVDSNVTSEDFYTNDAPVHTHDVDLGTATSSAVSTSQVLPYVQFLLCEKN